ncbi:unnamed protein product [Prorocentrum cordatum]|uniref:Uncharacterized protein n=1 Tax=Prorocentrum cordatum TaxID=2364126 RepID=A0ABN9PUU4_9DINO|nr:unnamed protein product [Polarella glacialis]
MLQMRQTRHQNGQSLRPSWTGLLHREKKQLTSSSSLRAGARAVPRSVGANFQASEFTRPALPVEVPTRCPGSAVPPRRPAAALPSSSAGGLGHGARLRGAVGTRGAGRGGGEEEEEEEEE